MADTVTLELPQEVAHLARSVASRTQRPVEDVLVEWLDHMASDFPVEWLPDDEVVALCDLQMDDAEQEELDELLARQRERELAVGDHERLAQLLDIYRRGLVRKAHAFQVAVERGLRAPLN